MVRHQRGDRSQPLPLGGTAGDVQPATLPTTAGRRGPTRRADAPVGAPAGRAEAVDRQPDTRRRVRRGSPRDDAAGRAGPHGPPDRRPATRSCRQWRRCCRRRSLRPGCGTPQPAPACRRDRSACARRSSPRCRGRRGRWRPAIEAYDAGDLVGQRRRRAPRLRHRRADGDRLAAVVDGVVVATIVADSARDGVREGDRRLSAGRGRARRVAVAAGGLWRRPRARRTHP